MRTCTGFGPGRATVHDIGLLLNAFGDKVKITGEGAGIHLLIDVKCGLTQEDLIARAAAAGIRLYPTRALYAVEGNAPQHQLLQGFPLVPESAFIGIMAKLHDAWEM